MCICPENFRMGNKDGFENEALRCLHDIGAAVIRKMRFSLHENATEFDEDGFFLSIFSILFT